MVAIADAGTVRPPAEIRVAPDRRTLTLVDDAGERTSFPAELLRVLSPSAEVRGHGPGQEVTVGGKRAVAVADLVPVGHYAVRIVFSDGHDSGLFTWRYFRELDRTRDERWADYLASLAEKGLARD